MDFTFDLSMKYSQEDYDAIFDTDFEHTDEVFLYNRKGKKFHFIKPIYCKDCKWCEKSGGILWCNIWHDDTNGLNFCSYAERRADGDI